MVKGLASSTVWREYECGRTSEDECYRRMAEKFSLDDGKIRQAVLGVRASIRPDDTFIRFIRELQMEAHGELRIFALSNVSAPDYVVTLSKLPDWSIFERVFTSADAGMRKPDLSFYKFVLDEIKAEPSSVTFVDDNIENVLAARSLGIHGIIFDDAERVRKALRHVVSDPVRRGLDFLEERAGRLESESSIGHNVAENLTQLLILEATGNKSLVNYTHHSRTWRFYKEKPIPSLGTTELSPDLDTTSIGLTATETDNRVINEVLDEMLQYVTHDGMVMVYFDAEQPYTDPIVSLNVLTLFYSHGRGHEMTNTLDWLLGLLEHRAYLDGTRFYDTPECFLFFSARLLRIGAHDAALHARLAPLLRARILERAGFPGDAFALAMRVLAGAALDLGMERDLEALLPLQCEDGGWEVSWFYKLHGSGDKIGNRGLTTALALNAIAVLRPQLPQENGRQTNLKGWDAPLAMVQTLSPQLQVTTVLPKLTATAVLVATLLALVTARSGIR